MHRPQEVSVLRESARTILRELGALQSSDPAVELNFPQGHTLIELERRGALNGRELAELLCCDKSSASRTLAELCRRGFVKAAADSADRRRKPFCLTAMGQKKVAQLHKVASGHVEAALQQLSSIERKTVVAGLSLYAKALQLAHQQREKTTRPVGSHVSGLVG